MTAIDQAHPTAALAPVMGHDETIATYREHVMSSFVAAIEPIVVDRAEGSYLWDVDGTRYVDAFAGIAVNNAGHRHPRVIAAAKAQMDKVVHAATYLYHVPIVAETARKLAEVSPGRLSKTFFGNSGAEGIETAMRLAKAATGRREFISLAQSFHGRTFATLSVTGNKARKTHGGPYMPGVVWAPMPYTYRNPFSTDDPETVAERCADMIEWAIDFQSSGDVAAFISETVWGEGGIVVPPASYFRRVKQILDAHGILLMLDVELVTDRRTKPPVKAQAAEVKRLCREAGVIVGVGGQLAILIRLQPPLVISNEDLDHVVEVLDAALEQLARPS